jgi:AraC family transcriptional regulator
MLRYFANGCIRWRTAMRCNTRTNWEFYAVIHGRCGLRFSEKECPSLHEKTLWVFAPECSHAWADDGRLPYRRISMHFSTVPYPLDDLVRQHGGWLEKRLTDADVARLIAVATDLEPRFRQPNLISPLSFQRHLMDLSLLVLEDRQFSRLPPTLTDLVNFRIERAVSWYAEHLSQNPTVLQVADAIHISPSHLRRLFWQGRKASPKAHFRRIRLEKAKELMSRSSLTLEDVARHCGFASASHLCREHKVLQRFTPTVWRKKLIDRFVKPFPPGVVHLREYSARPEERILPA